MLLLIAAWFILSNHCALALMAQQYEPGNTEVHQCCSAKAENGRDQTPRQPAGMCCKDVRVLHSEAAVKLKAPDSFSASLLVFHSIAISDHLTLVQAANRAAASDPPEGGSSFAELVLQRSLLSHAPPVA